VAEERGRDDGFGATLAAARTGDARAWSELYHGVAPVLIGYLRAQRLPDPEDVSGEVLLEVVRDLGRFDGDERGFRSWVLAIAHHRLLDARRRDARRPVTPVPTADLEPRRAADDTEATTLARLGLDELEPALATLTPEQRTVLLLRVVGDLPIADVAAIIGKRAGAVKQLQRRAVEAMRRAIDEAETSRRATPEPTVRPAPTTSPPRVGLVRTDAHGLGRTVR
jgi:RNA polymerase sigma factor (sigma-70 family)